MKNNIEGTQSDAAQAFGRLNLEIVGSKVQWKVSPGVVAEYISPAEFEDLATTTGLVVQKGVSALVVVDGSIVTELTDGVYEFVTQRQIDELLEKQATLGLGGRLMRGLKSLAQALTGRRVGDKVAPAQPSLASLETMEDVIRYLKKDSSIAVYLKRNTPFNVVFGASSAAAAVPGLEPFKIWCSNVSVGIAVAIQLRISDFVAFANHFMGEGGLVTCADVAREIFPVLKLELERGLAQVEFDESGFSSDVLARIESRLPPAVNIPGIEFVRIIELTASNEGIDRLHKVAEELYLSDRELEYARRTNAFRNRLASVENEKKIMEARTNLELHRALSEIDRDNLLTDDEMDEFYLLLSRKKKIREATSEQEISKALNDLERSRLLDEDDLGEIRMAVAGRTMQREHRLDVEKARGVHELEDLDHDHVIGSARKDAAARVDLAGYDVAEKSVRDHYDDERREAGHRLRMQQEKDNLDLMESSIKIEEDRIDRRHRRDMDIWRQWNEEDEKERLQNFAHEETLKDKDNEALRTKVSMTAEQITAEQLASLDPTAQALFAEGIGGKKAQEIQSKMYDEALARADRHQQEMSAFMKEMMGQVTGLAGKAMDAGREADRKLRDGETDLKNEYKENMRHEQQRYDEAQTGVMGHQAKLMDTAVDAVKAASGRTAPGPLLRQPLRSRANDDDRCPVCGAELNGRKVCMACELREEKKL